MAVINKIYDKFVKTKQNALDYVEKNKVASSLLINAVILIIVCCVARIQYEVSDDFIMETLVSGLYNNETTPFLPYSSVFLGLILQGLYMIYDGINWYGILMLFFSYIAFSCILYYLWERVNFAKGTFLYVVTLLFYIEDIYISLQFTKLAVWLIMVGSFIFLNGLRQEHNKKSLLIGGALVVFGSWYRFAGLYISGLYVLFMVLCTVWFHRKKGKEYVVKSLIRGGVLVLVILGSYYIDNVARDMTPEMQHYHEFNKIRASLSDFPHYGFENNAQWLLESGYSENDFLAATNWSYADTDVFSMDNLSTINENIINTRDEQAVDLFWVKEKAISRQYLQYLSFIACVVLGLLCMVYNPKCIVYLLPCIAISAGLFAYLYKINRIVFRVEFTIIVSAFFYILYIYTEKINTKVKNKGYIAVLLILMLWKVDYINVYLEELRSHENYGEKVLATYYDSWDNEPMRYYVNYQQKAYSDLLDEIKKNPQNYYYLDFGSTIQTLYLDKDFFISLDGDIYDNMSYLTGVTSEYPTVKDHLVRNGIKNPIQHLLEPDVYYVSNVEWRDEILLNFFHEHYDENIKMIHINTFNGFNIYNFKVENKLSE